MLQEQYNYDQLYAELDKYQYAYCKPQEELRKLLNSLPQANYLDLIKYIDTYGYFKIKRLIRQLKPVLPEHHNEYYQFLLQHNIKVKSNIPEDVIDLKKPYTMRQLQSVKSEKVRIALMNKLKDEFFIDTKSRNQGCIQFQSQYYGVLNEQDITQCLEITLRLVKRSEANLDTLQILLQALSNTAYDISPVIQSLHEALSEYLKNDAIVKCLQLANKLIRKEDALKISVAFVSNLIISTHNDDKKFQYFTTLNLHPSVAQDIYSILLSLVPTLVSDQQVFTMVNTVKQLKVPLSQFALLKKLVSINKFTCAFVSLVVAEQLLTQNELTKELNDVIESIFNSLQNNYKNFAKVVTQPIMFLSALKCVLLFVLYFEKQPNPQNYAQKLHVTILETINNNDNVFNADSHLVQLKYLTNQSCQQESQLFVECLMWHQTLTSDKDALQFELERFLPLFTLVSFSGKSKNSINFKSLMPIVEQFTQREDSISLTQLYNNLFKTFYYFITQINPAQNDAVQFRKDRLNKLVQFIMPAVSKLLGDLEEPEYVYGALSYSFISQKYLNQLKPTTEPNIEALNLLTNKGLQSNNPNTPPSIINLCTFFVNIGAFDQLTTPFLSCIDPQNLDKVNSLDVFTESLEQRDWEPMNGSAINKSGMKTISNIPSVDAEELQLKLDIQKLHSKGNKVMMMDENEVQAQTMLRHKQKLLKYFQLCLQVFQGFINSNNFELRDKFVCKYLDAILQFAVEPSFRYDIMKFSIGVFKKYEITDSFSWPLMMFFQARSVNTMPDDKVCQKIKDFQQRLLDKQQQLSHGMLQLVHLTNLYIIEQRSFDMQTKTRTFSIILSYSQLSEFYKTMIYDYYQPFINNINICAHAKNSADFLNLVLQTNDQCISLFDDILNFVPEAQLLTLRVLKHLPDDFGVHLKMHILAEREDFQKLAEPFIDKQFSQLSGLKDWDIVHFIEKHSREHVEDMITLMNKFNVENVLPEMLYIAATKLMGKIEEEQLEFCPFFINVFCNKIPSALIPKCIDILILYASDEDNQNLVQLSIEAGNQLIKIHGEQNCKSILQVIEQHMSNKKCSASSSICALIFLGVLSPHLKGTNQGNIQEQILSLFKTSSKKAQLSLAKCLTDLLCFFRDSENFILELIKSVKVEANIQIKMGNAYLIAGLLRGLGVNTLERMCILERLDEGTGGKKETVQDKETVLFQTQALIEIFGKLLEPYIVKVMSVLMKYFGDGKPEVRDLAISAARTLMQRMTGYGVKLLLPHLLHGLDEDIQWRGKVANIWALGTMAYCSPKQVSSRLPLIVTSISKAISDTHPQVREEAHKSLKLIGSTIKSPEIESISDILILSLSNPYEENIRGLNVVLETKFNHYIDAPAMSLLIPIVDYALKAQDSKQRKYGSILVGSLPILIQWADDLVPYMDLIVGGLEVVIGDPLVEVRSIAAKAIGQISKKIGIKNTRQYFRFVWETLENKEAHTIKRSGAAHALAEIICINGQKYFEEQIQFIFEQIQRPEVHVKEGYIGTFVYIPSIMRNEFEGYVKDVMENIQECLSHEEDVVSNMTMRVLKIIIKNFGVMQNELLYPTLTEAMMDDDWKKRNAGTLLSGEMLRITLRIVKTQLDKPASPQYINIELYNENLMMLYMMQSDIADQVRQNAVQNWKELIDNTPKTVKRCIRQYVKLSCVVMSKSELHQLGVNNISNFCQKYGEQQVYEVLNHLNVIFLEETNLSIIRGGYSVLTQLYRFSDIDTILKYRDLLIELSRMYLLNADHLLKEQIYKSLGMMINRVRNTSFVESLIEPYLQKLSTMEETDPDYEKYLDIFNQLCSLNSQIMLHYLVVLILVQPLDQYKVDIITNNASTFASVIYRKYDNQIPMKVILDELYACAELNDKLEWNVRSQSLIYCIGQLSIHIKSDMENNLTRFLRELLQIIETRSKPILESNDVKSLENYKYILVSLELLQYFLQNTSEEYHHHSSEVIPKVVPYIFLQHPKLSPQHHSRLSTVCSNILYDINNNLSREIHINNMRYMHTCFFNRVQPVIPGLEQEDGEGIKPYVAMLIDTFIYSGNEQFSQAIEFTQLLIKSTSTQNMQIYILKLIGALIRILNYRISPDFKVQALKTIQVAIQYKLDLSQFSPQLYVTYEKIVVEMNRLKNGLKQLTNNYSIIVRAHAKKDYLLTQLFNKAIQGETAEIRECYFKIVKKILKDSIGSQDQLFSSAVLERMFMIGRQYFDRNLKDRRDSLHETNSLGMILAITYAYVSKPNKESYISTYLTLSEYPLILRLQFIRFNELDVKATMDYTVQQVNTNTELSYVLQLINCIHKVQQFKGIIKPLLKPKLHMDNEFIIQGLYEL